MDPDVERFHDLVGNLDTRWIVSRDPMGLNS
jgi:hypothetical protein